MIIVILILGKKSFLDLRTINSYVCDSYKETCIGLGIVEGSEEWELVLSEAFSSLTGRKARNLFAMTLVFCEIPKPVELFQKFVDVLVEDIRYRYPDCAEHLLQCYALHQIENELSVFSRR